MKPLRILYHHRIRSDDGQAVHVRELIRALREEGHEVLECALVPKARDSEPKAQGYEPRTRDAASIGDRETRAQKAPESKPSPWSKLSLPRFATELLEIGYGPQGASRILAAARDFQPDLIYERHSLHCDSGLRAAKKLGVPLLLEVNSPLSEEMQTLGLLKFGARARATERRVLSGADHVFAVTEVLRSELIPLGAVPERCSVTPNGADLSRYGPETEAKAREFRLLHDLDDDAFAVGFIGYMRDWHRLDLAVELLANPGYESMRLVLVGEGPALPSIRATAQRLGVEDRVLEVGVVGPDELPAAVTAFDAALIPAINRYASPLKLFDSLAAGVATIAPRQPNLAETIEDGVGGCLFDPGRSEALDAALRPLVSDPELARRIGRAGRERLEREEWTWRGNARRVVEVFERLREGAAAS